MKLEELKEASAAETDMGDFIITQFELGKLTYDEALQKLIDTGNKLDVIELNAAADLKDDDKRKMH